MTAGEFIFEWRFTIGGRVLHALRDTSKRQAICGLGLHRSEDWMGTGSQAEYERAERLPLCKRCLQSSGGRR